MKCTKCLLPALISSVVAAGMSSASVLARENSAEKLEEVLVTGSFIKRPSQQNSPSPIKIVGREQLEESGAVTFEDFIPNLSINAGDEGNSDNFSGPRTQGTSNINLRGLGVGANLVLLNGRRQTQSAQTNNDGESFVDTASLVPMIAIERVEILKDGAGSLYGSDAITGVVNFITRDSYDGFDLKLGYQTTTDGDQDDYDISAIWGGGDDDTHFLFAASYLDRSRLEIAERDTGQQVGEPAGVSASGWGNPGNFITSTGRQPDPDCDRIANDPSINVDNSALGTEFLFSSQNCRWDFSQYLDLIPEETRLQAYAQLTHSIGDFGSLSNVEFRGEFGLARNRSERRTSPSFGPFSRHINIPADHPQNPFGEDVKFEGRVVGVGAPALIVKSTNDTWRSSGVFAGDINDSWSFEVGATWSINESQYRQPDTIVKDWQEAIDNFSYNPFGSAHFAQPGEAGYNDPALVASLQNDLTLDAEAELYTYDVHVTGDLFDMPVGPLGVAIGAQYRYEELDYDFDAVANADGYGFFTGNPDFNADRDVTAVFVEFAVPLTETLNVQLAVRYEDYGGDIGDTTDPKIAVNWTPSETLSVRASYSESFKAPTLFQANGIGTTGSTGVFAFGQFQFPAIRFQADPNDPLVPETADVYNIGFSLNLMESLSIDVDYWSFEFTDVIVRESGEQLAQSASAANSILEAGGTEDDLTDAQIAALEQVDFDAETGTLGQIQSYYRNAQSLDTDGIDLAVSYAINDNFTVRSNVTWVNEYTFETADATIEGVGFLNAGTVGAPSPEYKGNIGLFWADSRSSANVIVRYIDSYTDARRVGTEFEEVDSYTTVDAQYKFNMDSGFSVTVGTKNLFDEDIPVVRDFIGYDSKTHDARQRLVYLSFGQQF